MDFFALKQLESYSHGILNRHKHWENNRYSCNCILISIFLSNFICNSLENGKSVLQIIIIVKIKLHILFIYFFFYFCSKQKLWVYLRSASPVYSIYILEQNYERMFTSVHQCQHLCLQECLTEFHELSV